MQAYLASIEREIKSEIEFLEKRGVVVELYANDDNQMTDDELLAELKD